MVKKLLIKIIYNLYYISIILGKKMNLNDFSRKKVKNFVKFNNQIVMQRVKTKRVLKKKVKNEEIKISLLLPHCIQKYSCPYKITTDIENCRMCGLCNIKDLKKNNTKI